MTKDYPQRYESFGGLLQACLVLFYLYPAYVVFRTILLYLGAMGWLDGAETNLFTTFLLISYGITAGLAVWMSARCARKIKIQSTEIPGKITHTLILYAIMSGILAAIQFVLIFLMPSQTLNFLSLELSNLLEAIIFVSLVLLYLLWSRRVQCYYGTGDADPLHQKEAEQSI